jgi:hypothetical protein
VAHRLGLGDIFALSIRTVERRQIALDVRLDPFNAVGDLGHRKALVADVNGFELTPVDGYDSPGEQTKRPPAQLGMSLAF